MVVSDDPIADCILRKSASFMDGVRSATKATSMAFGSSVPQEPRQLVDDTAPVEDWLIPIIGANQCRTIRSPVTWSELQVPTRGLQGIAQILSSQRIPEYVAWAGPPVGLQVAGM